MDDWGRTILYILIVVYCVMPLALLGLVVWLVRRYLNRLTDPDVDHLHRNYKRLRAAHPSTGHDELVQAVIRGQSIKSGVVGAITGLGGFFTLPVTLPADVLIALRLQATTVQFIAEAYGHTTPGEIELEIRRYLIMSGGARVTRSTTRLVLGFLLRFVGRSLAKFIPLLGALIGFAVNYAIAQGSGLLAQRWYKGELTLPGHNPAGATLPPAD